MNHRRIFAPIFLLISAAGFALAAIASGHLIFMLGAILDVYIASRILLRIAVDRARMDEFFRHADGGGIIYFERDGMRHVRVK